MEARHRDRQSQEVETKEENNSFPRALLADISLARSGSHGQPRCKGVWEGGVSTGQPQAHLIF